MPRTWARATPLALILLIVLFGLRELDTASRKSLTVDEPSYIGRGLHLWRSGSYHFERDLHRHPPLSFHLASLPLHLLELEPLPRREPIGLALLARDEPGPGVLRLLSRLPFVLLSCWGALLCFLWAREAAGDAAGLLALGIYSFSPTLLAHAPLVHSDTAVSVFYLQTLYTWWRWALRPSRARAAACGVSLGLALATKLSAVLLLPTLLLLLGIAVWRPAWAGAGLATTWPTRRGARALRAAVLYAVWLGLAGIVVWLAYGASLALAVDPGGVLPDRPLPGYLRALLWDVRTNAAGRPVYFLGQVTESAPWYYLPVAFGLKVPLGILGLLALALISPRRRRGVGICVGVAAGFYTLVACISVVSPLGIRYLLPVFPLLFVFAATRLVGPAPAWRRAAVVLCLAALGFASLRIHPDYLAYFNEVAGGPEGGQRYLIESNLDWGQDLPTLAGFLARRELPAPLFLAYFGPEPPGRYGIRARPLPCRPVHGTVAISVNVLRELYDPRTPFGRPEPGCRAWLADHEPVARPGHSIYVYEIPDPERTSRRGDSLCLSSGRASWSSSRCRPTTRSRPCRCSSRPSARPWRRIASTTASSS